MRPALQSVLDEQGEEVLEATRFELSLEELERVERGALRGAKPGTKLHVVMEKTFPSCEYVSGFLFHGATRSATRSRTR